LKKDVQESRIFGIELSDDMLSVVGHPVELIIPSQDWEYKSYTINHKSRLWNEAPEMLKHDGMYYLMYSANMFSNQYYAIGYAKSNSPLGPFVKDDNNPVISSVGTIQKAGHNSIIKSPDGSEYFTSYTTLKNGRFISRIGFRHDGTLYVNGPIASYQLMPSGTTDFVNAAKTAKITVSSTKPNYRAEAMNDGEIGIYDRYEAYEWASSGEKAGAAVQLTWDQPHTIEYILIYNSAVKSRMIKSGTVVLNGNAQEAIHGINFSANSDPAVLHFAEGKQVTGIRFVVDELADAGGTAGLSEIVVLEKKTSESQQVE
jgi:hypothetical protein